MTKENEPKVKDMDRLIQLMKETHNVSNSQREKLQILTVVSASWSWKK